MAGSLATVLLKMPLSLAGIVSFIYIVEHNCFRLKWLKRTLRSKFEAGQGEGRMISLRV
jgi:hypothetical protein